MLNVRYDVARLALMSVLLAGVSVGASRGSAAEPDRHQPTAIVTEETPRVDVAVRDELRRYQNVRQAEFAGWTPDGAGMLIRTRFGNTAQLHQVDTPGGLRRQLTFYEEPVYGRFRKGPRAELLVRLSRGGSEQDQLYRQAVPVGEGELLTDGRSRHVTGPQSSDGSFLIVGHNARNGRDTDLFRLDLDTGGTDLLLQVELESWAAVDLSPDNSAAVLRRYNSINDSSASLLDLKTRELKAIAPPPETATPYSVGAMAYAHDGRSIYLATDARGEFLELARYDLTTGEYHWLSREIPWNVAELEVCETSGRLAVTFNVDGASSLYLLQDDALRLVATPVGVISDLEFTPSGDRLGLTLSPPDAPAEAYALDVGTGQLTRWTFSELGGLGPKTFQAPERVQFPTFDGRMIPAYCYRPRTASAERPAGVVMKIHGGPESQTLPTFDGFLQYLVAEAGLAVVAPNVRGSNGYGKSYLMLDNGPLREDSVRDIGALLDWIATQPDLDANRVAVMGASYGGYMVLASLTHFPERLRAGVDVVGIANFITFLENTSDYRRDLRRAEYGDERDPDMRRVFDRINPSANAHKIRSALLVIHGRNDPRVPFSEAEQIAPIVRRNNVPVWTIYADNEGHGFRRQDNREYTDALTAMFLQQYLSVEPAAAK